MRAVASWLVAVVVFSVPLGGSTFEAQAQDAPESTAAAATQDAVSPTAGAITTRSGEAADLSGQSDDMAFVSGGQVRISAQVADDIFASGGQLTVDGASADHLILAGGEVELETGVVRDVIAFGGRINFRSGPVSDDVVIAGGEINLGADARVEGSAVVAGGRVRIETPIARELRAAGGSIELNGPVGGDVRIAGGAIVIGPNARIGGDLHVRGESVQISPQAVVEGRTFREVVEREHQLGEAIAAVAVLAVLIALGFFLLHGTIAVALPALMNGADRRLRNRFWATSGMGAIIVLIGPLALVALLATVIGAPLALFLLLAYLTAMPLAFTSVAYWIGQALRRRMARAHATAPNWSARLGWTLLGVFILMIAFVVPLLGALAWLLTLIAGIGAIAAQSVRGDLAES